MSFSSNPKVQYIIKRFFNVRAWSDWDRSQSISFYFLNILRRLFVPQREKKSDEVSFDAAVAELKLTDADLQSKAASLKRLCIIMICSALCFYGYDMYQFIYGSLLGVILSTVLMFISLAMAFRYHFWYFQIVHRKLGCTMTEWFKENFMGGNQ